ncbi:hypothetical protein AJ87_35880 [Rhizobium yanglingense]|nr:hypothetical protein AJ87_35880 [Rhizobium yanglingense]
MGRAAISEIPNFIELYARGAMADKEPAAGMLHFLIQALDEAIAEPRRRDLAMPQEAAPDQH